MSQMLMQRLVNLAIGVLLAVGLVVAVKVIFDSTQPMSEIHATDGQVS